MELWKISYLSIKLETGPDLMQSLLHILLKFRKHRYGCIGDIEKAFPQVGIHEKDRDALRTLWLEDGKVWIYRFARLPFGLTCSPMILAAVLLKHLNDNGIDDKTREQMMSSLYVDDSIWSEDELDTLMDRKNHIVEVFAGASMNSNIQ